MAAEAVAAAPGWAVVAQADRRDRAKGPRDRKPARSYSPVLAAIERAGVSRATASAVMMSADDQCRLRGGRYRAGPHRRAGGQRSLRCRSANCGFDSAIERSSSASEPCLRRRRTCMVLRGLLLSMRTAQLNIVPAAPPPVWAIKLPFRRSAPGCIHHIILLIRNGSAKKI